MSTQAPMLQDVKASLPRQMSKIDNLSLMRLFFIQLILRQLPRRPNTRLSRRQSTWGHASRGRRSVEPCVQFFESLSETQFRHESLAETLQKLQNI